MPDTGASSGHFFFHVMARLAQIERGLTVERTKAGLIAARQQGRIGGHYEKSPTARSWPTVFHQKMLQRILAYRLLRYIDAYPLQLTTNPDPSKVTKID
jgi:DNA invertase Pin-like site-specific DNA recombinase